MPFLVMCLNVVIFFVSAVCQVFSWLLIVRIILSWVGVSPYTNFNELIAVIYQATDVILAPLQRLPLRIGPLDFSPMIALLILQSLPPLVSSLLSHLAGKI